MRLDIEDTGRGDRIDVKVVLRREAMWGPGPVGSSEDSEAMIHL